MGCPGGHESLFWRRSRERQLVTYSEELHARCFLMGLRPGPHLRRCGSSSLAIPGVGGCAKGLGCGGVRQDDASA